MSTNLGMVGVISNPTNCYLQAHSDGQTHCSNPHRNEEETWFLIEVDKDKHLYGLLNWNNQRYLSRNSNGPCAGATSTWLGPNEIWTLISGAPHGFSNLVAFRAYDGTLLGANNPGSNVSECGGEVSARDGGAPVVHSDWPGWWRIDPATEPSGGGSIWRSISSPLKDIGVAIVQVVVTQLLIDVATAPAA